MIAERFAVWSSRSAVLYPIFFGRFSFLLDAIGFRKPASDNQ